MNNSLKKNVASRSDVVAKSNKTTNEENSKHRNFLTAPELPGGMKYMLADEKDEDSDLHCIEVKFFKRNVQELAFIVNNRYTQGRETMRPSEYDEYKQRIRNEKKVSSELQAVRGFQKKLQARTLIMIVDDHAFTKTKSFMKQEPPKEIAKVLSMPQRVFEETFPKPTDVLDFWLLKSKDPTILEFVSKHGQDDWLDQLVQLDARRKEKDEKRKEKIEKKIDSTQLEKDKRTEDVKAAEAKPQPSADETKKNGVFRAPPVPPRVPSPAASLVKDSKPDEEEKNNPPPGEATMAGTGGG